MFIYACTPLEPLISSQIEVIFPSIWYVVGFFIAFSFLDDDKHYSCAWLDETKTETSM